MGVVSPLLLVALVGAAVLASGGLVRALAMVLMGMLLGLVLMGAVMITTYFTEAFKMTLVFGVPFLLILSAVYYGFFRKGRAKASKTKKEVMIHCMD